MPIRELCVVKAAEEADYTNVHAYGFNQPLFLKFNGVCWYFWPAGFYSFIRGWLREWEGGGGARDEGKWKYNGAHQSPKIAVCFAWGAVLSV